jgi:hypothetical protein
MLHDILLFLGCLVGSSIVGSMLLLAGHGLINILDERTAHKKERERRRLNDIEESRRWERRIRHKEWL